MSVWAQFTASKWPGVKLAGSYFAAMDCGVPDPLPNGTVFYNSTVFGSVATYSCVEGYELIAGDPLIQCQADGEWSNTVPRCEREYIYTDLCTNRTLVANSLFNLY